MRSSIVHTDAKMDREHHVVDYTLKDWEDRCASEVVGPAYAMSV